MAAMARTLVGVDGCAGAWLAVMQQMGSASLEARLHSDPASLVRHYPDDALICVDVPIGLPSSGSRDCDREARRLLRRPRQSRVFPAPIRPTLSARTREEASAIGRRTDGRGVGTQAWGIFPYVRAWDELLRRQRSLCSRVLEVHPELCFYAMNQDRPMRYPKKSPEGAHERRRLLDSVYGAEPVVAALEGLAGSRFGLDDYYDSLAALWTAGRVASGKVQSVPAESRQEDPYGLTMAIHY